jgi:transposase
MDHFAGLDVSVKQTSICIVDDTGRIVREVKVASEPEALLAVLKNPAYHFERIGLEAGPLSQWLFSALAEVELPVVCVETRHMQAVLKAQINKTDRNDARGIAQMMRAGLYRPVHVKTLRSQKLPPGRHSLSLDGLAQRHNSNSHQRARRRRLVRPWTLVLKVAGLAHHAAGARRLGIREG